MKKTWKRICSLLMAFAMLAVLLPAQGLTQVRAETQKDWAGYTPISTKEELNNVRNDLNGKYYLTQDIVFTEEDFAPGGDFYNDGQGWETIGDDQNLFKGVLDGNGHAIVGLKIHIRSEAPWLYVGLFSYTSMCTIQNLGLEDIEYNIEWQMDDVLYVGGLVGSAASSEISNCYVTGSIHVTETPAAEAPIPGLGGSSMNIGGLVGSLSGSTVSNCYNASAITAKCGWGYAGGLVGNMYGSTIDRSYNTGCVLGYSTIFNGDRIHTGNAECAGIVAGASVNGSITNCYNAGMVTALRTDGDCACCAAGILCRGEGVDISNCYNVGKITTSFYESYMSGYAFFSSLSDGTVFEDLELVDKPSTVTDCYYLDTGDDPYHQSPWAPEKDYDLTVRTAEEMCRQESFAGFDFDSVWTMKGNPDYPYPELKDVPAVDRLNKMERVEAKDPTCTAQGNIAYWKCKDCGLYFEDREATQVLWPTSTIINPMGHSTEIVNAKEPTATEPGYTGDEVCRVCGETVKKGEAIPPLGEGVTQVYRIYNPGNGKHHYTTDAAERDFLAENGWIYEGIAWNAPQEGAPIYRVYNPGNDNHLYTMDAAERDRLVKGGWNYEGILCYSAGTDGVPLYRVFNPYVTLNPHHYTDSLDECEFLESNGWKVEGISWYGLKK